MTLTYITTTKVGINLSYRCSLVHGVRALHTTSPRVFKAQAPDPCRPDFNQNSKQEPKDVLPNQDDKRHPAPSKAKTVSQADAELRERLEQMSGEGGASGIEYEDGKPNAMKRGVRNNMFRLI